MTEKLELDESINKYKDSKGNEYERVNHVIKSFGSVFEREIIAERTAKKRDRVSSEQAAKMNISQHSVLLGFPKYKRGITKDQVLAEWNEELRIAGDNGNIIHNGVEKYLTTGIIPKNAIPYSNYLEQSREICAPYKKCHFEKKLSYNNSHIYIAGTADKILERKGGRWKDSSGELKTVVDIGDTKTNGNRFRFDSTRIDFYDGTLKVDNNFYSGPIAHLEDCYYNQTALQLSIYGYMLENMGYKVGKLFAEVMDWKIPEEKATIIHFPYLRKEVMDIIDFLTMKKIGYAL